MKKYIAFCVATLLVLSLAACNGYIPNEQDASSDSVETTAELTNFEEMVSEETTSEEMASKQTVEMANDSLLKAWMGTFNEEALRTAINDYQSNYHVVTLDGTGKIAYVSFETDFEIAGGSVSRLSPTDNADINVELNGYIDLDVGIRFDGNRVTIETGWWYRDGDWTQNYPVWSYLVRLKDGDGTTHYYYFRIDYTP